MVRFDIDSFIGFLWSLKALQRNFGYTPVLTMSQNIRKNIYIQKKIKFYQESKFYQDSKLRQKTIPIHLIPYLYIGSVVNWSSLVIYICLLMLYKKGREFQSLNADRCCRLGNLMIKACRAHVGSDYFQHIPRSRELAERNACARAAEGVSVQRDKARKGALSYTIRGRQQVN